MNKFWKFLCVVPGFLFAVLFVRFLHLFIFGSVEEYLRYSFVESPLLFFLFTVIVFLVLFVLFHVKTHALKNTSFFVLALVFSFLIVFVVVGAMKNFPTDGVLIKNDRNILIKEVKKGFNWSFFDQDFVSFEEWKCKVELPYIDLLKSMQVRKFLVVIHLNEMDNNKFLQALENKKEIEKGVFLVIERNIEEIANTKKFPKFIEMPDAVQVWNPGIDGISKIRTIHWIMGGELFVSEYVERIEIRR